MPKNNQILAKILTMDADQLAVFMSTLKPDTLEYLEVILSKAEKNTPGLKRHLDKK